MNQKNKTSTRTAGLSFVVAGACFLADPFVSVFDFLPDLVGYLLILHGLSRLCDLDSRIQESSRMFRKLAILAGVRLLTVPFIFGLTSPAEQGVELLLFAFCLGVLDCLVLVSAWRDLSAGLIAMASLHGGTFPLLPRGKRRVGCNRTERLLRWTLGFMLFKEIMAVLPEMTVLNNQLGGAVGGRFSHLYDYIAFMREVSAAVTLVFGIVWLVQVIAYARGLKKDTAFFEGISETYHQFVTTTPGVFIKRNIYRALILIGVGVALTTDFYADGINILPDALAAACFIAALIMLRPYAFYGTPCLIGAIVLIPLDLAVTAWQGSILHELAEQGGQDFTLVENAARLVRDPEAYSNFYMMCGAVILIQLGMIALLFGIYKVISSVINRYTGLYVTEASTGTLEVLHASMRKRLLLTFAFGAAAAVFSAVYMLTLPLAAGTAMEIFGLLDTVLHICFAVLFFWQVGVIREQMEYRFLLT